MATTNWETVYIFISSTFDDMHAERGYLVKQVLPELRDWCEARKIRLRDVDLRWGVTEADTRSLRTVEVCLENIDKCRPFFICLSGQRYGWCPTMDDVSEQTLSRYPGLRDAIEARRSMTELEVLHASSPLKTGYDPTEHVFFYLRDPRYLEELPNEPGYLRRVYADAAQPDGLEREFLLGRQRELREKTIPSTGRPVRHYGARWLSDRRTPELSFPLGCPATNLEGQERWRKRWKDEAGVDIDGLDIEGAAREKAEAYNVRLTAGRLGDFESDGVPLGELIVSDLKEAIGKRFPGHMEIEEVDALQKELDQQEQFIFVSGEGFIPRSGDFDELDAYVDGDSHDVLALTADAGMGKSTLLGRFVERFREQTAGDENTMIQARFIGQSDGSATVSQLLWHLLLELKDRAKKLAPDTELPLDPIKLLEKWPDFLEEAGKKGKTVIVVDALNQLQTGLNDLDFVPRQLPDNVKLIISFKQDDEAGRELLQKYRERDDIVLTQVRPFENIDDRRALVGAYLRQFLKSLDENLLSALINTPGANNPLYLKVLLSELRVFGAFGNLGEKLRADFGDTPVTAFDAVLRRLEADPIETDIEPAVAVPLLFGLLSHARFGLSVEELAEMFRMDMDLPEDRKPDLRHTIELLTRQVRIFLARRDTREDYFYETFAIASRNRYVIPEEEADAAE